MIDVNFNKQKQVLVIKIEVLPPVKDGERDLTKRERVGKAFQLAHDELQAAWKLATQDNDELDAELAVKAAETVARKAAKLNIDLE